MHNYRELLVWKKAMDIAEEVYRLVSEFPENEKYNLTQQLRRCSVSVPSNIAEGAGRDTDKEFSRYLGIARGSVFELQTQITLGLRLQIIENESFKNIYAGLDEIGKMLTALQKSLKSNV